MADNNGPPLPAHLKHIEDIRSLSVCKICMRSLYEPYVLSCGHTYCYTCLASWFGGAQRRNKSKSCPDCRTKIMTQPSPNYLLRDLVHMLIGRADLLPEDETIQEHQVAKEEEAAQLAADRNGPGLFKGIFLTPIRAQLRWGRGILDLEDNVVRCPECHWEIEDGECGRCGFNEIYDSDGELLSDYDYDSQASHMTNSEFDADDDIDRDFETSLRAEGAGNRYASWSRTSSASEGEEDWRDYYDEDDGMNHFIDNEADEDDDDTESTMTMYNRQWSENETHDNLSEVPSQESADSGQRLIDRYTDYGHRLQNEIWESDLETNYDELTEASDSEVAAPPPNGRRPRPARVIISDDDDDEEEENDQENDEGEDVQDEHDGESEDQDEGDLFDEQRSPEHSEAEATHDHFESEDSDVGPPQSLARRRQHLRNQRARRYNHGHQVQMESSSRRNSPVRQRSRHRLRSNTPQSNTSGRRDVNHLASSGFGRRIPVGGI
ncbi:uncharacterized protein PV07_09364 [Cladophialophora immunda]|uniref:RING-type domain-containing protein n=1 Tax=Cladophialophora immunda TaxID=569365 RepID=A0A0D1ZER4_9EURO|nr:uncharacterized protein PV07_09364 [Cladophialophora immunda]KIW26251.1 hypothetical protein PV07_09364 [Cladophialophora immunda]